MKFDLSAFDRKVTLADAISYLGLDRTGKKALALMVILVLTMSSAALAYIANI